LNNCVAEKDFNYIHWEKDDGGPETFELIIHGKSEQDCKNKKQLILNNQKKLIRINDVLKDSIKLGGSEVDRYYDLIKSLEIIQNSRYHSNSSGEKQIG